MTTILLTTCSARARSLRSLRSSVRHTGYYQLDGDFTTDSTGVPICPKREPMAASGFCPDRCRQKWRCPRAAHHLPKPCQCSPSAYGRVFYTVPLRQKCVITSAICASQKIADNEGLNMIENRQCLERASESIVKKHGRSRQDSENLSRRSRFIDR